VILSLSTLPVAMKAIASSVLIIGWVIMIFAPSIYTVYPLSSQSAFGINPGENGKIVFTGYGDNTLKGIIYVMNADGSGQTSLSIDDANNKDYRPDWSPDGTKIAFTSYRDNNNNEIYVMNAADGSGQTMLTNSSADETWPSWSPDGTKIAFESDQDGNGNIYAMNAADGSNQIRLTNSTANDCNPRWSPDGTKIVFDSNA
jgi:Tol biopolymer transport system component